MPPEGEDATQPLLGAQQEGVAGELRLQEEERTCYRGCCCFCCAEERTAQTSVAALDGSLRAHSRTFWLAVVVMLWASFCYGTLFGSLSPVLTGDCDSGDTETVICPECLNCDMDMSESQLSMWILVGPLPTVLLGPLGGAALDRLGHRRMMVVGGVVYVIGWIVLALTPGERGLWNPSVEADLEKQGWISPIFLYGGRLLSWGGFSLGAGVPGIYLAEIAQPQHRGAVGGACQLAIMLGTLAEFGLGAIVRAWRVLYAINGLAFLPCLVLVACIPPSPRWLHIHRTNRRQQIRPEQGSGVISAETVAQEAAEVHRALARFYRPGTKLGALLAEVAPVAPPSDHQAQALTADSDGTIIPGDGAAGGAEEGQCCCTAVERQALRELRSPVAMCAFIAVAMQLCPGGTVVVLFAGPILEGFAPETRNTVALLCNAAALPGCLIALAFADRCGRRKLLAVSAVGQCLASVALGTVFLLKTRDVSFLRGEDLTLVAALSLAAVQFSYTLGWGTLVGVTMSELMPTRVRGVGTALAQGVGGLANTAIATLFTPLAVVLGLDVIFYALGVTILVCALISLFWLPQTEGRALEDIESHFRSGPESHRRHGDDEVVALRQEVGALQRQVAALQDELAKAHVENEALLETIECLGPAQ